MFGKIAQNNRFCCVTTWYSCFSILIPILTETSVPSVTQFYNVCGDAFCLVNSLMGSFHEKVKPRVEVTVSEGGESGDITF